MTNTTLTQVIEDLAKEQWASPDSLSCRNAGTIPESARSGFALLADMGGVLVLCPDGSFRAFLHDTGAEVDVPRRVANAGRAYLRERYPRLAELLDWSDVDAQ